MGLEEINLENADKFVTLVDADMMENIGRVYYRGMALTDDGGKPQATMIWELIHSDDEERDTESRLMQLNADGDQAKKLFAEYKKDTDENEIRQTSFELACETALRPRCGKRSRLRSPCRTSQSSPSRKK